MKRSPEKNYRVRAYPLRVEAPPAVADYFEGLYALTLNELIEIAFVPALNAPPHLPLQLPADFDNLASPLEARRTVLAHAHYLITPAADRAGEMHLLPFAFPDSAAARACPVFYVSPAQFVEFVAELRALSERTPAVLDFVRREDVLAMRVMRFIETVVLNSMLVTPAHLHQLQRPIAAYLRQLVEAVDAHNTRQTPLIYHGYFDRLQWLEFSAVGYGAWEKILLGPRKRFVPDKRALLLTHPRQRDFWSLHRSLMRPTPSAQRDHFICGLRVSGDKDADDHLRFEQFKDWQAFDEAWDYPTASVIVPARDAAPGHKEIICSLAEAGAPEFIARVIGYLSGQHAEL